VYWHAKYMDVLGPDPTPDLALQDKLGFPSLRHHNAVGSF